MARYGILELQTMDYHGTYMHAVRNLRDGLRLHRAGFPAMLGGNLAHWAGEKIEGPNRLLKYPPPKSTPHWRDALSA